MSSAFRSCSQDVEGVHLGDHQTPGHTGGFGCDNNSCTGSAQFSGDGLAGARLTNDNSGDLTECACGGDQFNGDRIQTTIVLLYQYVCSRHETFLLQRFKGWLT